jgi:hypothetical protein
LYLLITDLLADLGSLQLICQLCLCFLQVSVYSAVRCDKDWKCKVWASHSGQRLTVLGWDVATLGEWFLMFQRDYDPLTCQEPPTQRQSITSQKTWILRS